MNISKLGPSKSIILIGTYLICVGIVFGVFGFQFIQGKITITPYVYRGGIGRLNSLAQDTKDHQFKGEAERDAYIAEYNELKDLTEKWIAKSDPRYYSLNYILIGITTVLYIFAGIRILNLSQGGIKFLNFGGLSAVASYLLFRLDLPYYMVLTQLKVTNILRIVWPEWRYNFLTKEWFFAVVLFPIIEFIVLCYIYIIIPKRFISRPKIKSQLT